MKVSEILDADECNRALITVAKLRRTKTLEDCADCLVMSCCDAHITGGSWKHREGPNPCRVVIDGVQ